VSRRSAFLDGRVQIKGTKSGLLVHLYDRPLADSVAELRSRLTSTPDFYKGSRAVLMLGSQPAEPAELAAVVATLEQFGIVADGAVCDSDAVATQARSAGLRLVAASVAAAPRSRDDRTGPAGRATSGRHASARNGQPSATRHEPAVTFHKGTLRSGQTISAVGTIVVVGDVNAGAELVASGDIVVWGALRGVAHAGAQGDESAAVYALRLEPMQLRISRSIAIAPPQEKHAKHATPEVARIREGKIAIERA
jgi:septum site-determining protein MinC